MKKIIYVILNSILFFNISKAQSITETEIFKNTSGVAIDPYGVQYDKNGNWAFLQTDNSDPNIYRSRIISNKFTSDWYENLSDVGKYDGNGNLFSFANKMKTDGSYEIESFTMISNGVAGSQFEYVDPYNSFVNSSGEYEFIYKRNGNFYIGRQINGKLSETGPYDNIKYVYKSVYNGIGSGDRGEGDGVREEKIMIEKPSGQGNNNLSSINDGGPNDQFFRDANGNVGYILQKNGSTAIQFGDNRMETIFADINEASFQYDNNKDMVYIGKDRTDYSYNGFQTLVTKNNKYMVHGIINTPVIFMSDNSPVFSATDSLNETTYLSKLYKGDKEVPVYRDASRTKKVNGFTSGISDITISNGKIYFTGTNTIIGRKSKSFPDGEFTSKGSLVVDGVMGPELENLSMIKRSSTGKYLYSYMPDHNKSQYSLFTGMNSPEIVIDKGYSYFTDYDFIPGTNNFYAVASKDGNYDKGLPGKSYVYINNKMVGEYEALSSGTNFDPNSYSVIRFAPNGDYAFGGAKSFGDTWIYNVYTKNGMVKVDKSSAAGLGDFNSVDYLYFTPSNKLFYIGGVNTSEALNFAMKSYVVYDGKVLDKYYDNIQDLNYNQSDNTINFKGVRDNAVYNVKVNL